MPQGDERRSCNPKHCKFQNSIPVNENWRGGSSLTEDLGSGVGDGFEDGGLNNDSEEGWHDGKAEETKYHYQSDSNGLRCSAFAL